MWKASCSPSERQEEELVEIAGLGKTKCRQDRQFVSHTRHGCYPSMCVAGDEACGLSEYVRGGGRGVLPHGVGSQAGVDGRGVVEIPCQWSRTSSSSARLRGRC